jgi:hypothetical protein
MSFKDSKNGFRIKSTKNRIESVKLMLKNRDKFSLEIMLLFKEDELQLS